MHAIIFPKPQERHRGIMLFICCGVALLPLSIRGADTWTDVSSPLLERLTNSSAKLAWPGGCSGVVVNRLNGEVTIKVVGVGLWSTSDTGKTWQRIDDNTVLGQRRNRLGHHYGPERANPNGQFFSGWFSRLDD